MGIDVASFGDFFVDKRLPKGKTQDVSHIAQVDKARPEIEISMEEAEVNRKNGGTETSSQSHKKPQPRSGRHQARKEDQAINCLVYKDPFSATYKKYIFTEDGKYLLGGMMVGDVSDFVKLVAIVKKKVK